MLCVQQPGLQSRELRLGCHSFQPGGCQLGSELGNLQLLCIRPAVCAIICFASSCLNICLRATGSSQAILDRRNLDSCAGNGGQLTLHTHSVALRLSSLLCCCRSSGLGSCERVTLAGLPRLQFCNPAQQPLQGSLHFLPQATAGLGILAWPNCRGGLGSRFAAHCRLLLLLLILCCTALIRLCW